MRILLAAVVAISILGGIHIFLNQQQNKRRPARPPVVAQAARGQFQIELVPTFDAGPDAFTLETESAAAIVVELHGKPLLNRTQPAPRGQPIVIENVAGLVVGQNELFVRATAAQEDPNAIRAMRVRVLRNEMVVAQAWLSSEPGTPAAGTVSLTLGRGLDEEHNP